MPPFFKEFIFFLRRVNPWVLFTVCALIFVFFFLPALNRLFMTFDNRVHVNPKDLRSPQYAYRLDEFGLLQIASEDIQTLEKKKQYGEIYERYGSREFQKTLERRDFMKMANCAEKYLGGIIEFDRMNLGFKREGKAKPLDVLTRRVRRSRGEIFEQLVFVGTGVDFKLNGLYWVTTNSNFLECTDTVLKEIAERSRQAQLEKLKPAAEPVKEPETAETDETSPEETTDKKPETTESPTAEVKPKTEPATEKPKTPENKPAAQPATQPLPTKPIAPAQTAPATPPAQPAVAPAPKPQPAPPQPPQEEHPTTPGSDD